MMQGYSAGGSQNSSYSISNTAGNAASETAQRVAAASNSSAQAAWRQAAEYNAKQAEIQRQWQEQMANTVYQRTIKDMRAAGINPVLAAGMGLGTASVGGGSAASISPAQIFNAQTFPESNSASQAQGNSWSKSESGLLTALNAFGEIISGAIGKLQSSHTIEIALKGLEEITETDPGTATEQLMDMVDNVTGQERGTTRDTFKTENSRKYNAQKNSTKNSEPLYTFKSPGRMNEAAWGNK